MICKLGHPVVFYSWLEHWELDCSLCSLCSNFTVQKINMIMNYHKAKSFTDPSGRKEDHTKIQILAEPGLETIDLINSITPFHPYANSIIFSKLFHLTISDFVDK